MFCNKIMILLFYHFLSHNSKIGILIVLLIRYGDEDTDKTMVLLKMQDAQDADMGMIRYVYKTILLIALFQGCRRG